MPRLNTDAMITIVNNDGRIARALVFLVPLSLLGGAYFSQYVGGLWPCEMCWWQRYAHFAAAALGLASFWWMPADQRSRAFVILAAIAIGVGGGLGFYHAGVEAKIFQGFTACSVSMGAGLNPSDMLKQIMAVPLIQCDQVQWRFLGLSLAAWNAIISLPVASLALLLNAFAAKHNRQFTSC